MSSIAGSFANPTTFDLAHDITWSFQYSLCGPSNATGGFATFLYTGDVLSGGGVEYGLGYGPDSDVPGVSGLVIAAGMCSTPLLSTGGSSLIIKKGSDFAILSAVPLPSYILQSSETYQTIRFNLTDVGQTLNIHRKGEDKYELMASIRTGILALTATAPVRVGVSYSTPLTGTEKARFRVKNFHLQGVEL